MLTNRLVNQSSSSSCLHRLPLQEGVRGDGRWTAAITCRMTVAGGLDKIVNVGVVPLRMDEDFQLYNLRVSMPVSQRET